MRSKGIALLIIGLMLMVASFYSAYWEAIHRAAGTMPLGFWCACTAFIAGFAGVLATLGGTAMTISPEYFTD